MNSFTKHFTEWYAHDKFSPSTLEEVARAFFVYGMRHAIKLGDKAEDEAGRIEGGG